MPPDIVYVVRRGEANEPLRYSLRSLANLPHGRVWIAGYCPAWLKGVGCIPVRQAGTKYRNSTANLAAACRHPDVSEEFIFFHDDLFVTRPIEAVPVVHRGTVAELERYYRGKYPRGQYLQGMRQTRDLLIELGFPNPLSYEVHAPMPMTKAGFLEVLKLGRGIPALHKRTLYGNYHQVGGQRIRDPKVIHSGARFDRSGPFLSTMPRSWRGGGGQFVRSMFPRPSPYETRKRPVRARRR